MVSFSKKTFFTTPLTQQFIYMTQHFIHTLYEPGATIAAIATPPGSGGVAILRISGNRALEVAQRISSLPVAQLASHTVHYTKIIDEQGSILDHALLIPFKDGRSYTGEETVEIHCHGGQLLTELILALILRQGARAALPGEFTCRAFLNGKLDLSQAEAVQALIGAKNIEALSAASNQLAGSLSKTVKHLQSTLTHIAAILEAWVDFPEEGLEFASMEEVLQTLQGAYDELEQCVATYHHGRMLQTGVAVCLIGAPNVGKSSLMNALLDTERAIVSPIAGTTRDVVHEEMRLHGIHMRLTDTAGIRDSTEVIEQEGIRRSHKALEEADLVLFVLDCTRGLQEEELTLIPKLPVATTIAIWNKCDLLNEEEESLPTLPFLHQVKLSAKTRDGLSILHKAIDAHLGKGGLPSKGELVITHARHKEALLEAMEHLDKLMNGLREGESPEFLSMDMRSALQALGKILGTHVGEDILSAIFSTFCVGK